MTPNKRLTALLTIALCAAVAASCGTVGNGTWPPAEDLRVQPKPVPPVDVVTSDLAGERHDNAVEAWGEAGWLHVGRLCRFFDTMGMDGLKCPGPEVRPPDPG